jgi:Uma2 family endonuclease
MLLTVEQYAATQHGDAPTELVRGIVVNRSFPYIVHGIVCANVCHSLGDWHRQFGFGIPIALRGVITRRGPDSLRSIDVGYYNDERRQNVQIGDEYTSQAPVAAFEVRSHDDTWLDIMQKVNQFMEAGTSAFVVVDPFVKTTHVFQRQANVRILHRDDELTLPAVLPKYRCQIRELFE